MTRLIVSILSICLLVGVVRNAPAFPGEKDLVSGLPGLLHKTNFKHYSGYLESVDGNFLHYWFFESQSAHPEKVNIF